MPHLYKVKRKEEGGEFTTYKTDYVVAMTKGDAMYEVVEEEQEGRMEARKINSNVDITDSAAEVSDSISDGGGSCITGQPEGGVIDVPHTPEAESALLQECRERLSLLESHIADPLAVGALQNLDGDLASFMSNVAATEEYECVCEERHDSL